MLDFYFIKDDQKKPLHPEHSRLEFAGGLDYQTFENLKKKGIIDSRFDYYSDFRIETLQIKQIRQTILQESIQIDSDAMKLTQLLDTAEKKQSGLIAFGD